MFSGISVAFPAFAVMATRRALPQPVYLVPQQSALSPPRRRTCDQFVVILDTFPRPGVTDPAVAVPYNRARERWRRCSRGNGGSFPTH